MFVLFRYCDLFDVRFTDMRGAYHVRRIVIFQVLVVMRNTKSIFLACGILDILSLPSHFSCSLLFQTCSQEGADGQLGHLLSSRFVVQRGTNW